MVNYRFLRLPFNIRYLAPFALGWALVFLLSFPAQSQFPDIPFNRSDWDWYDCPLADDGASSTEPDTFDFGLPLALKLKFPLDLIYPVTSYDLDIDTACQLTSLWGIERELCAPSQIAKIAKDIFLLRFVLQSLLAL